MIDDPQSDPIYTDHHNLNNHHNQNPTSQSQFSRDSKKDNHQNRESLNSAYDKDKDNPSNSTLKVLRKSSVDGSAEKKNTLIEASSSLFGKHTTGKGERANQINATYDNNNNNYDSQNNPNYEYDNFEKDANGDIDDINKTFDDNMESEFYFIGVSQAKRMAMDDNNERIKYIFDFWEETLKEVLNNGGTYIYPNSNTRTSKEKDEIFDSSSNSYKSKESREGKDAKELVNKMQSHSLHEKNQTLEKNYEKKDNSIKINSREYNYVENKVFSGQLNAKYSGLVDSETGMKYGYGRLVWDDKSKYEGEWVDDKACGVGKLTHVEGDEYVGEWVNDKADGFGKYNHHEDGSTYIGFWRNDKQHGKGIEKSQDGTIYRGNFKNGLKHGKGVFSWADGSSYDGEFCENCIHGTGKYTWKDTRNYSGNWNMNQIDGYGKFVWPNGRSYEGYYKNDKKHGFGKFFYSDGSKYVGNWENGLMHGEGQLHTKEGENIVGIWNEGQLLNDNREGEESEN